MNTTQLLATIRPLAERYATAEANLKGAEKEAQASTYALCVGVYRANVVGGLSISAIVRTLKGVKGTGNDTLAACAIVGTVMYKDDKPEFARPIKTALQVCVNNGVDLTTLREMAAKATEAEAFLDKLTKMGRKAQADKVKAQAQAEEGEGTEDEGEPTLPVSKKDKKWADIQAALAAIAKMGYSAEDLVQIDLVTLTLREMTTTILAAAPAQAEAPVLVTV